VAENSSFLFIFWYNTQDMGENMKRIAPTIEMQDIHQEWFAVLQKKVLHISPDANEQWKCILQHTNNLGRLKVVLQHNPPLSAMAEFFAGCVPAQAPQALLILDTYKHKLIDELRRTPTLAQLSGLGALDPMLAWDVWNLHKDLWRKYITYGGVLLEEGRPITSLKILLLDNLPALIDVIPTAHLSCEQTKQLLHEVCANYEKSLPHSGRKNLNNLSRCAKALLRTLPKKEREAVLSAPPYPEGTWDDLLTKKPLVKPVSKPVVVAPVACSTEEAQQLRKATLSRPQIQRIVASSLSVEFIGKNGWTLLQQVVAEKHFSSLPLVLSQKPNMNVRTAGGDTVCHRAAAAEPRALKMLLEAGANPWLKNDMGDDALNVALRWLNAKNVRVLLNHPGFDPTNPYYMMELMSVSPFIKDYQEKMVDIFNLLVEKNVSMDWSNAEYANCLELLERNTLYGNTPVLTVFKRMWDQVLAHKQALSIEQHVEQKEPSAPAPVRKI